MSQQQVSEAMRQQQELAKQGSQTEAQAKMIRHHVRFDLSDGAIDEARVVQIGGQLLRYCQAILPTEKVEYNVEMPGGIHFGGGYVGGTDGKTQGQASADLIGTKFREDFGRHSYHYGNNLGFKIGAEAARQDAVHEDYVKNYADTKDDTPATDDTSTATTDTAH